MSSVEVQKGVANSAALLYYFDLSSKLIAKTGIVSDRYHIGKLVLESLKEEPNFVSQVDADSNESLNFKQTQEMTVRCAYAFRKMGLKKGDVMVIMADNNLHLLIPYHAAMYEGVIVAPIDRTLGITEIKNAFEVLKPKLVFSLSEKVADIQTVLKALNNDAEVITYDKGTVRSLDDLLKTSNESIDDFKPIDFDPEAELALIIPTSGTTGLPKFACHSYKSLMYSTISIWGSYRQFPYPSKMTYVVSVFQWMSAHLAIITGVLFKVTRLMSRGSITRQTTCRTINKYRPTHAIFSTVLMINLLKEDESGPVDLTCFDNICLTGAAVYPELLDALRKATPNTKVQVGYGVSECTALTFSDGPKDGLGRAVGWVQIKLVDMETQEVIKEFNRPGEAWIKAPSVFKGYYNNPEATMAVFSKDGWFKTGDILYQDENSNYHYVDRAKQLLKYMNNHVSPTEVEGVITKHSGVEAVAVVGKPHMEFGELIAAFVVRKPGAHVTAQDIKQIVADNLTKTKHLSGGVIFLDEMPVTPSYKVNRALLKEMVKTMQGE